MKKVLQLIFIGVFCACMATWAQDTAQIVGTVTDASGAVIPGAKVTVANPDRGYTRVLETNAAGAYVLSAVPIGTYNITAEATGFQKLTQSGITLTVGQIQRVDMSLKVGQVTQEVTVAANAPVVQTETAAISDVITGTQISNLNLNGRNFVTLATLVPGAVPTNDLNTSTVGVYGNNSISFNGVRTQYNNWEIDGGNNTDEGSAGTFNTYPNLDTIAEFRISTSNYGADMGKHAGATIEVATKSGTRTFHGDAFEYARRDWMDANPFFVNRQVNPAGGHAPKAALSQHEYGYTIGGPVYIPGHYNTDKSKTFFFWSEDWRKILQGQTISSGVPSVRQRNGDFSECDSTSPNYNSVVASGCALPELGGTTYNTVQAMPGYNATDFNSGLALLDAMVPLPNSGPNDWILASPTETHWRQEQIRVDQNISDKTQVFVRYTQDAWNTLAIPSLWAWANYDTVKTPFGGPGKSMVLHITHSFTPTLMNEFIASYTTDHIILDNQVGGSSVAGSIDRPSSFAMGHFFTGNDSNPLLPGFESCEGGPCFSEDAANHPWTNANPIINWKDNVVWSHGAHTLKFGFFLQDYRKNEQFGANTQGYLTFDGGPNSTGNSLANLFLGRIASYQEGTVVVNGVPVGGYPRGHWVNHDFEPYINDDWRVNPHLTVNIGLRYYFFTRIHDITKPTVDSGFIPSMYDPSKQAQLDADGNLIQGTGALYTNFGNGLVECGANGIPQGCQLRNTGGNWAPRFGFSWDPWGNGKTVIRGGYGIYYEVGNGNEAQTEGGQGNPPVNLSPTGFNYIGYSTVPHLFDATTGTYAAPLPPTGYTMVPYDQKWGSVQQFNFGFQHQFAGNNILSVAYVGNLGRHLAQNRHISYISPGVTTGNAPALANFVGTNAGFTENGQTIPGDNGQVLCDASGNCDVQTMMIYQEVPSTFFQKFRGYNNMEVKQNTANSVYNALQVNFRHPFGHGLLFQTSYTWSKNRDNASSTYGQNYQVDDSNLNRWWATSDLNRTQVWQINYVYDMPFFKNSGNKFLKNALGGWTISGITSFYTGTPIDVAQCGRSGFSTGIATGVRCNTAGKVQIQKGTYDDPTYGPVVSWYDPNVLVQPNFSQLRADNQPGMFGYGGRNLLTGPGRNNTDLALLKNFTLPWFYGENSTIQFRWETFNSFNHTQWRGVNTGCSDATEFGAPCGDRTNNLGRSEVNSAWDPRIMQFGLKFIF